MSEPMNTLSVQPFISIVMPIRNEARFIRDTLEQLLSQDYPPHLFEVLVADGMSDDGTQAIVEEIAQSYPQIRLMDNPGRKSGAGRNIGFRNGRGDIFVVVDGHCYIPDNQLLRNIADCFEKSGADCLGRPQPLDPPGLSDFQKSVALARASRIGHGGDSLIFCEYEGFASPVSNGAAYSRPVFEKIGYVDEIFDACEDVEFNYRVEKAGFKTYTSPSLTIHYYPRENFKGLFRQLMRYGRGRYRFIKKHPDALTLNQLIPALFVAGVVFLLLSNASSRLFGYGHIVFVLLSVLYSLYLLIISAESCRIASKNGMQYLPYLPLIFLCIHFVLGYGCLVEALADICTNSKDSL